MDCNAEEFAAFSELINSASEHEDLDQIELILGNAYSPLHRYCPETPWPKQQAFLDCDLEELLFGGAGGGAKTSALLMAALQYVDVPGYAALILRRDMQRMKLDGSIMDRSHAWFAGTDAKWNGTKYSWTFPSSATITFSYIDNPNDRYRFKSSEFQYIAWEELTEFRLPADDTNPYLYMFSRLRNKKRLPVPLRFRAATNPGDIGHDFVQNRFVTDDAIKAILSDNVPVGQIFRNTVLKDDGTATTVGFMPSFIKDNPAIDESTYSRTLGHLPYVTRRRMLLGDWTVRADGILATDKARYWTLNDDGQIVLLDADLKPKVAFDDDECYRFTTIDPAGTSNDRVKASKGKGLANTAISTFDLPPKRIGKALVVRNVWKDKVTIAKGQKQAKLINARWNPSRIRIENEKLGHAWVTALRDEMPIDTVPTKGQDKLTRSTELQQMWENGEVYLPLNSEFTNDVLRELTTWTGLPEEPCDVLDTFSYAAIEASGTGRGVLDSTLFQSEMWFDSLPPNFDRVVCGVQTLEANKISETTTGAIVFLGIRNDGKIYVDAICERWNMAEAAATIIEEQKRFGRPCDFIGVHSASQSQFELFCTQELVKTVYRPAIVSVDPKIVQSSTIEFVIKSVQNGVFRWRSTTGTQAVVSRLKAYPYVEDVDSLPLQAFGLALNSLLQ